MNKKTAFEILNFETTISLEEAKKAYRNLAKKYHPDVVEKKSGSNINAEATMKEINLAFRYLAPLLKSHEPIKKTEGKKKSTSPERLEMVAFLSKIVGFVLEAFQGKEAHKPFENKLKKKSLRNRKSEKVRFEDVFKSAYKVRPEKGKKTKKKQSPERNPYHSYQKYMVLKRKINSGRSNQNQDMSVGRIDKIDPVKPVKPVTKN
jgi:curved DNA-binding protein CbpA